jgi:hypothetical protein
MNKTILIILLGIVFYPHCFAQRIPYGYKCSENGNILSSYIIIQDGFVLDSAVNVGEANRTFSFEYNKNGKLKRDVNISRSLDRVLVNGRWTSKYMPGTEDYYYNKQGYIDSVGYGHWKDSSWVNDTSGTKNQYSQDGKILSTTYLSKGNLMTVIEYCYDSIGNLKSSKYRSYGSNGSVGDTTYSFFTYDSQNRLTLIKTYDILNWGQVGQYIYQHDSSGNIIRIAQRVDTSITSITSDSSIISIDTTYGSKILFRFDEAGKIIDETSWGPVSTADTRDTSNWIINSEYEFHYEENNRILNVWDNEALISFHYNTAGNLDTMVYLHMVFPFGMILADSYGNRISLPGLSGLNYFYYNTRVTDVKLNNSSIKEFALSQNYPNPFNPSTTISFSLPSKSVVSLKIFDMLGREIATIVNNEMLSAGNYSKQWNAQGCCSGVYFYRLRAGTFTETKKLILLR